MLREVQLVGFEVAGLKLYQSREYHAPLHLREAVIQVFDLRVGFGGVSRPKPRICSGAAKHTADVNVCRPRWWHQLGCMQVVFEELHHLSDHRGCRTLRFTRNKHPLRWVKPGWLLGEFVDVTKMWVNLFHFCWRWVKIFWRWMNLSFSPISFFKSVISPTSFFCFIHLQISPIRRFHLLADFIYLHLSCVMITVVCVRLHVIFTHCFLSHAVPQK